MAAGVLKSLGELTFQISPDMGSFAKQLESGMSLAVGSTAGTIGALFSALGKAMLRKFTLPLAIGAAANIAQFQALDREIRSTITLLGTAPSVVDSVFDGFSADIARVSTEVGGLERDIADGLYQAISAGVPRGNVGDFLEVAQMAAIADKTADMTTAVDGITTALNAFNTESLTATQVADIMFATVAKGKTTMGELSQSIGRAAGIASNAGVKFAEFQAVIGTLTLGGFKTAEAVSFLRAAITGLLRPGEDMDKVFQDIGFATAEAAIPVIGLQAAFQTVVDAAGGSTSKLQELIGTSEGVSAILGVTGANAEKFAGVLRSTENAAGFLSNAFEIAEGGIGRSFGRMTEAFDRLGNRLGAIASEIAAPFADIVTEVINSVIGAFKFLEPVIDTAIDLFKGLAKAFDVPGLKQFLGFTAAIVISLGAVLGVLAPIILLLGVMLKAFVALRAAVIVLHALAAAQGFLAAGIAKISVLYQGLLRLIGTVFPAAVVKAKASVIGFSAAVQTLKLSLGALLVVVLAVTAAIAIGVILWQKYKASVKAINDQALVTSVGIDTLADSLGFVLTPANALAELGEVPTKLTAEFVVKNQPLINQLEDVMTRLGEAAERKYVLGILADMKARGLTPAELFATLQALEAARGVTYDININFLGSDALADRAATQLDLVLSKYEEKLGKIWQGSGRRALTTQMKADLTELADVALEVLATGGPDAFEAVFSEIEAGLADMPEQANFFADQILKNFETKFGEGEKLGFDIGTTLKPRELTTLAEAFAMLSEVEGFGEIGVEFDEMEAPITRVNTALRDNIEIRAAAAAGRVFTPEMREIVVGLGEDLDTAFTNAEDAIEAAFATIRQEALDTIPFLDVYQGAADIDWNKWLEGSHQFVEDSKAILALRDELVKDASEGGVALLDAFDASPMDQQAWLTTLSPTELNKALEHINEQIEAAFAFGTGKKEQESPRIIAEVTAQLEEDVQALAEKAAEGGTLVATRFGEDLDAKAAEWPGIVRKWLETTGRALTSTEFGGSVSVGGPSIIANITVYNNKVSVDGGSAQDPGTGVRRALQGIAGRD